MWLTDTRRRRLMWLPEARVAVRWCGLTDTRQRRLMWMLGTWTIVRRCHTFGDYCKTASALLMCRSCFKNTFINRLEEHTQMSRTFVLATGCANGFTMSASQICGCSDIGCNGDALWYAAQMQGFCTGCCGL